MASTYSSRLRIELIGTGEQSGVWGTTTNTNLGTLLEESIAGVASVTMTDADYTLTAVNGATDQSRQAVLVISGTLSAARNVICPSQQKIYIIKNATAGGFSITLKTSGGSGVAIANGQTALVYCTGSAVVSAISELTTNTRITGTLTATGSATFGGALTVNADSSLDGAVVINDAGADKDVRIEGDTDANLFFTDASTDRIGVGTNTPLTKFDLLGANSQNVVEVSASEIDCAAGNYFTKTATGALTWTTKSGSVPSSRFYSFVLELTNGGLGNQTWMTGTKWSNGVAPGLQASGVDILGFITDDGGTTWRGVVISLDNR